MTKQVNVDSYFVNVNADPRAVKPLGRALHVVKELDMRTSFKLQSNPSFHSELLMPIVEQLRFIPCLDDHLPHKKGFRSVVMLEQALY